MHEMSVARSLIKSLEEIKDKEGLLRITEVRVKVGILTGVEPSLLEKAFYYIKRGTSFEDTNIIIEIEGIRVKCINCGYECIVKAYNYACPSCGSPEISLEGGDSLIIESVKGL